MNSAFSKLAASAAVLGIILTARGGDDPDQADFPLIISQPTDQGIPIGSNATFTVQATNGDLAYQWLRNGVAIDSETNSSLTLLAVGTDDAALYSCGVSSGPQTIPTRSASLSVITPADSGGQVIIYSYPARGGGSQGTCPGSYAGYANYTKTVAQGWGWAPSTNTTTIFTASDGSGRTDTKITYMGRSFDSGCNQTTVTIPNPPFSPSYRFTIYFPNNVPTTNYPIILTGFNP